MTTAALKTDEAFARFSDTLDAAGLRAALAYLLGLTDYRFIAKIGRASCRERVLQVV